MEYMWGGEMHAQLWCGNMNERNHLEDLGVYDSRILNWILKIRDGRAWSELIWLRNGRKHELL
jgi:hypothetical protein